MESGSAPVPQTTWERPDAPLGTLIYRAGLVSKENLEAALEEGQRSGRRLGEVLLRHGWLDEADLARLLAGQKALPFVRLHGRTPDPDAAPLVSEAACRRHGLVPIEVDGNTVVVAIADPTDEAAIAALRSVVTHAVRLVVAPRSEILAALDEVFGTPGDESTPGAPVPSAAPEALAGTASPGPALRIAPQASVPGPISDPTAVDPLDAAEQSRRIPETSPLLRAPEPAAADGPPDRPTPAGGEPTLRPPADVPTVPSLADGPGDRGLADDFGRSAVVDETPFAEVDEQPAPALPDLGEEESVERLAEGWSTLPTEASGPELPDEPSVPDVRAEESAATLEGDGSVPSPGHDPREPRFGTVPPSEMWADEGGAADAAAGPPFEEETTVPEPWDDPVAPPSAEHEAPLPASESPTADAWAGTSAPDSPLPPPLSPEAPLDPVVPDRGSTEAEATMRTPETRRDDAEESEQPFRVVLHLDGGDSVVAGSFGVEADAEAAAHELVTRLAQSGEWPRIGSRFFHPARIVSVEIFERPNAGSSRAASGD